MTGGGGRNRDFEERAWRNSQPFGVCVLGLAEEGANQAQAGGVVALLLRNGVGEMAARGHAAEEHVGQRLAALLAGGGWATRTALTRGRSTQGSTTSGPTVCATTTTLL